MKPVLTDEDMAGASFLSDEDMAGADVKTFELEADDGDYLLVVSAEGYLPKRIRTDVNTHVDSRRSSFASFFPPSTIISSKTRWFF